MGAPIPLEFGLGSDPGRDGANSGPMHWNCFVEPVKEGKSPAPLRACDGLSAFANLASTGSIRGQLVMGSYLYAVSGTQLYRVDQYGASTIVGAIPGTGKVMMARNDATTPQMVIITGDGERYSCISDAVASIGDADLPTPVSATYLNQRILYGIGDGRVFFSAVDDLTDIDPLDVFTAEGSPDGLVAVVAHMQEAWCFGRESIEIWRNTTDDATPFVRNEVGVVPRGAISKHTIKSIDIDLFWVGEDRSVYRARGYAAEQIAPFGVLEDVRRTAADDYDAMTYTAWGHAFYVLSGTRDDGRKWTWAFNRTTSQWDPRFSYGDTRWLASEATAFVNQIVVGAYNDGTRLYRINRDAHDEAGTKMVWRARTAPMHAYPHQLSADRLSLDLVTGVGLNSADLHESTPYVGLRWSDDGGFTWSNQELRELGQIGRRNTRVTFEGLGTTEPTGRIWEVEMSSPVIRSLMLATVEGDLLAL